MAKPNEVLDRMTSAKLSPVFTTPLDQIKVQPEHFRHRADADLDQDKGSMQALMKSLTTGGQREPLIVYRVVAKDGTVSYILVAGHRRFRALTLLAEANVAGFSPGMDVNVVEILDGNRHDYLLWSVADNVIRVQIDELHRLKAALLLLREGVDHTRIKVDLDLSDSTFDRYKRLAANLWMLGHVERDEIGLTDAHLLLEAAGGNGGRQALKLLQEDLARLVAVAKGKIQVKREELAERHKDLKGREAVVKSYFPPHLVKKWVLDLKHGRRIKSQAKFVYGATIETDKIGKKLIIPAVSMYLVEQNLEPLAEIIVQLDRTLKDGKPQVNALARQRHALAAYGENDGPADFRSAGLDAVAELLSPRSAPLPPDDGVTLEDREATLREMNENFACEDREDRQIVPATDGIDIPDAQPQSDESDAE
jgi:ParB-like chromosome segregation protein Spo0J